MNSTNSIQGRIFEVDGERWAWTETTSGTFAAPCATSEQLERLIAQRSKVAKASARSRLISIDGKPATVVSMGAIAPKTDGTCTFNVRWHEVRLLHGGATVEQWDTVTIGGRALPRGASTDRCGKPDPIGRPCNLGANHRHDVHDGSYGGPYVTADQVRAAVDRADAQSLAFLAHVSQSKGPSADFLDRGRALGDALAAGLRNGGDTVTIGGHDICTGCTATVSSEKGYDVEFHEPGCSVVHKDRRAAEAPLVALVNAVPEGLDANGWRAAVLAVVDYDPGILRAWSHLGLTEALRSFVIGPCYCKDPQGVWLVMRDAYRRAIAPQGPRPKPERKIGGRAVRLVLDSGED